MSGQIIEERSEKLESFLPGGKPSREVIVTDAEFGDVERVEIRKFCVWMWGGERVVRSCSERRGVARSGSASLDRE